MEGSSTSIFAEKSVSEKRLQTCLDCSLVWKNFHLAEQCSSCMCFVRAKVKLANQSCPVGKW